MFLHETINESHFTANAEGKRMSELVSNNAVTFLGGMLCGTVFALVCCRVFKYPKINPVNDVEYDYTPDANNGSNKLVLIVRNDLKMGKGKVAAQCSHAAVLAHELSRRKCPDLFADWKRNGQPKIIVKVDNEAEMMELAKQARENKLLASIVQDAGRTQVPSGSRTVLAVGPGPEGLIDQITEILSTGMLDVHYQYNIVNASYILKFDYNGKGQRQYKLIK